MENTDNKMIRVFVKPVESDDQNLIYSPNVVPMYIDANGGINACNASNIINPNLSNLTWYKTAERKRLFKIIDPYEIDNYKDTSIYSLIIGSNLVVEDQYIKPENENAKMVPFKDQFIVQSKNKTM